jgi:hypothetical protein
MISINSSFDAVDQCGSSERLGQEAKGSGLQRARTLSSGKAVIKITGAAFPWARIWVSRSKPLMAGIWTSAMTHDESFRRADCKNSAADANVWTRYPCELRRLLVAARTDASSSITEITESVDKIRLPEAGPRHLPWQGAPR